MIALQATALDGSIDLFIELGEPVDSCRAGDGPGSIAPLDVPDCRPAAGCGGRRRVPALNRRARRRRNSFRSRREARAEATGIGARPPHRRYSYSMRPLRSSINVTLDGCCDHRAIPADEELHRHAIESFARAGALLFGRVTCELMEAASRPPAQPGARPDWTEPFARTIDAAKKYVVSSALDRVDRNAERVRGDPGKAVEQLQRESGKGLLTGGVTLPFALAEPGTIASRRSRGGPPPGISFEWRDGFRPSASTQDSSGAAGETRP